MKHSKKNKNNEDEDEDDNEIEITYLSIYYTTIEEFIDKLHTNFDNELFFFKFYLDIKDLFQKYLETFKLRGYFEKRHIFEKIKEYIQIFIEEDSGYLNELLEILSGLKKLKGIKSHFYSIIAFIVIKFNECGKNYIFKEKYFIKFHSHKYFEQSNFYFEKYFPIEKGDFLYLNENIEEEEEREKRKNIFLLPQKELESLLKAHKSSLYYLRFINSGTIFLSEEFLNKSELINTELIVSNQLRGIILAKNIYYQNLKIRYNKKTYLEIYEKILSEIQASKEFTKIEALCIANIIKINSFITQSFGNNHKYLFSLAQRCETIVELLTLNKKEKWYLEFEHLYNELLYYKPNARQFQVLLDEMKTKYPDIFREIEEKFNKKNVKYFINFIITRHPCDGCENYNLDNVTEALNILIINYSHYNCVWPRWDKEKTLLEYCIGQDISEKLRYFYSNLNKCLSKN